jgi:hypothetical protein
MAYMGLIVNKRLLTFLFKFSCVVVVILLHIVQHVFTTYCSEDVHYITNSLINRSHISVYPLLL